MDSVVGSASNTPCDSHLSFELDSNLAPLSLSPSMESIHAPKTTLPPLIHCQKCTPLSMAIHRIGDVLGCADVGHLFQPTKQITMNPASTTLASSSYHQMEVTLPFETHFHSGTGICSHDSYSGSTDVQ